MKQLLIMLFSMLSALVCMAQSTNLPIKEFPGDNRKALFFYISGDGGMNSFTTDLCKNLQNKGLPVVALNARSYFWQKKDPQQTANEVASFLKSRVPGEQKIVFAGFSFGADVLPFIYNRLPAQIKSRISTILVMAPSTSTDFEIHLMDMAGSGKKRSMDVASEINKIGNNRTVMINNEGETDLDAGQIKLPRFYSEVLKGDHHFSGSTDKLVNTILKYTNQGTLPHG